MGDPKEMTVDEAIYCMKSYLPDHTEEKCTQCRFYGIKEQNFGDQCFYVCQSAEAHRMAIEALKKLKESEDAKAEIF